MITAYYSTILEQPVDRVWALVRDFNNYPVYIEGVTESVIEDDKRGDEVGAIRRFNYGGNWIRQRLVRHRDEERLLTYAGIERLAYPAWQGAPSPSPVGYEGTIHLTRIVDGERTFIEWPVLLDPAPGEEDAWHRLFIEWIPQWTESLRRTLARG
jgi:Polyketide cyclase / dehydrase and lipid transport